MSPITLAKIERAGRIDYTPGAGSRAPKGTFKAERVQALVSYYQQCGVTFVPDNGKQGPGIRYLGDGETKE